MSGDDARPRTGEADDGTLVRLADRTGRAAGACAVLAVAVAASAWVWPAWAGGAWGTGLAVVTVAAPLGYAVILGRRAARWRVVMAQLDIWRSWYAARPAGAAGPPGWFPAACGAPQPLHGTGGPRLLRRARRYPAHVVGVRAAQGPLADGAAVFVHGRGDGLLPARGDVLAVFAAATRGPFLLGRAADGAVFAADRWSVANL